MKKLIDEHFHVGLPSGRAQCKHCGRKICDQGLAKITHLASKRCQGIREAYQQGVQKAREEKEKWDS